MLIASLSIMSGVSFVCLPSHDTIEINAIIIFPSWLFRSTSIKSFISFFLPNHFISYLQFNPPTDLIA